MSRCLLFCLLLAVVQCTEVLLEVSFDIALKTETETGFKPTDTLNEYLEGQMKWLRTFHMLLSGSQEKPQRVAFLAFRDTASWATFEEEHLVRTHALFDHFWLNSKRVLWYEVEQSMEFPEKDRTIERSGGFVWQFKYSVIPGKEKSFTAHWERVMGDVVAELKENLGFVESRLYSARNLQRAFQHMVMWEFLGMSELAEGVLESKHMQDLFASLPQYCSDWNSAVLTPPTDEDGKQVGFFYPAAGADVSDEGAAEGEADGSSAPDEN
eukprot:TRINITY_DN7234_c0_g1_i3.p1 TRINITY_DN7234_c0_g1~~TRINITY_DN7234_c0_g1_i3.p1  ORF type:complete len:268 (-),score=52.32 TRINITY_DN7234_c0_g1_i3:119-922(-)